MPRRANLRRAAVLLPAFLLVLVAWTLLDVRSVQAHAIVVRTDPEDNAALATAPRLAHLYFSQAISTSLTRVELEDSQGDSLPTSISSIGETQLGAQRLVVIAVALPQLSPGIYRLSWHTISSDDLHPTNGSIVFGVQETPPAQALNVAGVLPGPFEVILRYMDMASFSILAAAILFLLRIVPHSSQFPTVEIRRRLRRIGLEAGLLGLCAGLGLLAVQSSVLQEAARAGGNIWAEILLRTPYGRFWIFRQGLLALVTALLAFYPWIRARVSSRRFQPIPAAALLLVAVAGVGSLSSHTANSSGWIFLQVAVETTHKLAAGFWAGGLFLLLVITIPLIRGGLGERATAQAILRRFGWPAALCVAALVVTGLYMAGLVVASLDALLVTYYGQTLLFKIFLVAATMLAGLLNSASLHQPLADLLGRLLRRPPGWRPHPHLGSLRPSIRLEAVTAALVVLAAALLVSSPPARGPLFDPPPDGPASETPSETAVRSTDLLVTLSIRPNRPGQNFINVGVFDTRRPARAPVREVELSFIPPNDTAERPAKLSASTLTAASLGNGRYQVDGSSINAAGDWTITVLVKRQGLADERILLPWTVQPPQSTVKPLPVLLSNKPLAPIFTLAAILLACLVLAAILLKNWRGFRSPTPQNPTRAE